MCLYVRRRAGACVFPFCRSVGSVWLRRENRDGDFPPGGDRAGIHQRMGEKGWAFLVDPV